MLANSIKSIRDWTRETYLSFGVGNFRSNRSAVPESPGKERKIKQRFQEKADYSIRVIGFFVV
jgi:hypothetical protein